VTILAQRFQEFHSTVEPAVPIISYDVNLLKAAQNPSSVGSSNGLSDVGSFDR
jgi:hypothetical protein